MVERVNRLRSPQVLSQFAKHPQGASDKALGDVMLELQRRRGSSWRRASTLLGCHERTCCPRIQYGHRRRYAPDACNSVQ